MRLSLPFVAAIVLCLPGCASIIEGTSQEIMVNTTPDKAQCDLVREGNVIASIKETPASTVIKKTKYDMTIK
jgi:hypothetical protein